MTTQHEELTKLLQGRTINGTAQANEETILRFTDGSKLTVRTPRSTNSNSAVTGGAITGVKWTEKPDTLHLEMPGGTMAIPLADATGGVRLESEDGNAEYPHP